MKHELEITDMKIYPAEKTADSKTLARCIVTFNGALIVSGIRIKEGKKGIYICFPLTGGNTPRPVVYPASGDARREISNRILATYIVNHCCEDYLLPEEKEAAGKI